MNLRSLAVVSLLVFAFVPHAESFGQEQKQRSRKVVRIGAVATPAKLIVFKNLQTYLNRKGYRSDYVLYANYDALVDALDRGEIDVAWNSPMSHAKYHLRSQCASQTLAMRRGDLNLHVTLLARGDSGIKSLKDLHGKRLILGNADSQSGELLPVYFLNQAGVDVQKIKLVRLSKARDGKGERGDSPTNILKVLQDGRGDAAIVPESVWRKASAEFGTQSPTIQSVWTSPAYNHCVFTASKEFDKKLGERFTRLITEMDDSDPLIAELNRLEHTNGWVPGDSDGFRHLVEALRAKEQK